ncbi:hypothetical protein EC973_006666 [Apophysomyces ossiformis]|uniref:Methyltransferase domain-containing protein n=1 Tax=Apophysomyces ossiformis TaxID=679940 RepID=A0A8H7EKP7_9FUNG|nr:hypothetical protein EC973_006666 [Apophysomyces ossiformis]
MFVRSATKSSTGNKVKSKPEEAPEPKFPIREYDYIEGRNYRQPNPNKNELLPCDDEEIERLEINHLCHKITFLDLEEQFKKGIRALDVGCGPGWWMREMAESYPSSHFTGVDNMIYPISNPPINCHFRIADASKGLPFPDNTFDYVSQRDRLWRLTRLEWDTVINEMIRVTKPGGWLEFSKLTLLSSNFVLSPKFKYSGIKWRSIAPQLPRMLSATDKVTELQHSYRSIPIGWLGKAGDIMLECTERMFDSMKPRLCEDWSMGLAKYDKVVQAAAKECRDFKSWTNVHYVYCRKKLEGEETE